MSSLKKYYKQYNDRIKDKEKEHFFIWGFRLMRVDLSKVYNLFYILQSFGKRKKGTEAAVDLGLYRLEQNTIYFPWQNFHQDFNWKAYRCISKLALPCGSVKDIGYNHLSTVKDYYNTYLSVSHQSYICTCVFYKKQMGSILKEGPSVYPFQNRFPEIKK